MTFKVFAVFDKAVGAYGLPIFVTATGAALRSFMDEVNNVKSVFFAHPEDYSLYELGEFDEVTGFLFALEKPVLVCTGISCKSRDD